MSPTPTYITWSSPAYFFNKYFSICHMSLFNFQSPEIVVFDNFVNFHHGVRGWESRFAELLTPLIQKPCLLLFYSTLSITTSIYFWLYKLPIKIFCIHIWTLYIYLFINLYVVCYHTNIYYKTYMKIWDFKG